jgi:hypothetical protein
MDSIPPKNDVAGLSPEQQEAVARLALSEARFQEKQLERIASYRGTHLVSILAWIGGLILVMWIGETSLLAPLLFFIALLYIEFHVRGTNARLDALIRMIDLERDAGKPGQADNLQPANQEP